MIYSLLVTQQIPYI